MALTHLIDTSVATRLGRPSVRARLVEPTAERSIGRTRITDLELGFSARNSSEWDTVAQALAVFPLLPTTDEDLQRAGRLQRALADVGHRGRKLPDLIIAAVGERLGLCVLHYDSDFDLIAAISGQPVAWVVPRGSID